MLFSIESGQKSLTKERVFTVFAFPNRERFTHAQKGKNFKLAMLRQAVFLMPFTNHSRLFSENSAESQAKLLAPYDRVHSTEMERTR